MTDLHKIALKMQFDMQIINECNDKPKGMTYDEYLKIKKEEIKSNLKEAIEHQIDLVDRATKRLIAWKSANEEDMANEWKRIKEIRESDLNDLQKEYDLIFGK